MFEKIEFKIEDQLLKLVADAKMKLSQSIQNIQYPDDLTKEDGKTKWKKKYKEIDKLNKNLLYNISDKNGVYALYLREDNDDWTIQYAGQTKSGTSRQRIRSHIVWRNNNPKAKKITGSKFDEVQQNILSGKKLGFSFVEICPGSLRHYIEENLIKDLHPPWNLHGKIKNNPILNVPCSTDQ